MKSFGLHALSRGDLGGAGLYDVLHQDAANHSVLQVNTSETSNKCDRPHKQCRRTKSCF